MKIEKDRILLKFEASLDASKYKVYKESLKCYDDYAIINYQSKSVVDFNIPDDEMIYGIGTLIYRMLDEEIFEVYPYLDKELQIKKILNQI